MASEFEIACDGEWRDSKRKWDSLRDAFNRGAKFGVEYARRTPPPATAIILDEMWGHVMDAGDMMPKDWCDKLEAFFNEWGWLCSETPGAGPGGGGDEAEYRARLTRHLHAREHHRYECQCDDCSWVDPRSVPGGGG